MSKNNKNQKNKKFNKTQQNRFDATNLLLLLGMLSTTIIFVAIIVITLINPGNIKQVDDIREINISRYDDMGSEEETEYLLFIYASEQNEYYNYSTYRNKFVEEKVIEYAKYASDTEGALPIYRIDISKKSNLEALATLKLDKEINVPAIIKMKFNEGTSTINTTKKNVEQLIDYLDSLMK